MNALMRWKLSGMEAKVMGKVSQEEEEEVTRALSTGRLTSSVGGGFER